MSKSALEAELLQQIILAGFSMPRQQYRFCPDRKWAADFAWPDWRILVEVEGGIWSGGRHTTGAGFEADAVKYNKAELLGWVVLRFTGGMIHDGRALETLEEAFRQDFILQEVTP
jgi:very-short-patch-repair endonuclease